MAVSHRELLSLKISLVEDITFYKRYYTCLLYTSNKHAYFIPPPPFQNPLPVSAAFDPIHILTAPLTTLTSVTVSITVGESDDAINIEPLVEL
jgi:hypothetical protein